MKFVFNFIIQICVILLLTLIYMGVFHYVDMDGFPMKFLIIPLYFLIYGLFFSLFLNHYYKNKREKMHNFYLIFRSVKLIVSMVFLLAYAIFTQGERILGFTIMFFIFYVILLTLESFFCLRVEREIKKVTDK